MINIKVNQTNNFFLIFLFLTLTQLLKAQDYHWTGDGDGIDFFQEANWVDLSTGIPPYDDTINPSQSIDFNLFLTCDAIADSVGSQDVDIASQTPVIFSLGSNGSWPYIYTVDTIQDQNDGIQQTFVINITSLPPGGAQYRINKTVANEQWSQSNSQNLSLGINTINVNAVSFNRSVKFQFSSGAIVFDTISLNGNSVYSVTNSSILLEPIRTLQISNGTLEAKSISGGSLILNENSYVNLSDAEPLLNDVKVYLNSDISWLRLENVKPNLTNNMYLSHLFIFGATAQFPSNIRFDNYYDNGTVIRTNNLNSTPLTIYSDENITGSSADIAIDQVYSGTSIPNQLNDNIRSFYLKRGYMLTLAVNDDGTGKSKVFIASDEDLQLNSLPDFLIDKISFIRIVPWNWVSKKGTGGDIQGMDNTWFYRWNNQDISDLQRENSPMSWGYGGANDDDDINLYRSKYKATHVLGFNEPDDCLGQSGQYNNLCDVTTAVDVYENLMKTGLRLVSPACRQGAVFTWLNSFNTLAVQHDIRIDVIAVHWYDWGDNPQGSPNADATTIFNRFKTYLNAVYAMYGLPIWITEFNGNKYRSIETNRQFMELAVPYLEGLDFVERYAWFEPQNIDVSEDPGNAEFFDDAMNLTDIGTFYKNHQSTPSIPAPFYIGPDNLDNSVIANLNQYSCEPYDSPTIWTGIVGDKNYDTAANWSTNVVPEENSNIIITSDGVIDISRDVTVNSINIAAGASIISNGTINGSLTYNRNLATTDWYLISSPVIGQDIDSFVSASNLATGAGNNLGLANYDNIAGTWSYYQSGDSGTETFTSDQGHALKLAASGEINFRGTFNDADVSIAFSDNNNGFNLIGNPYLSSVSVGEILNTNSSLLQEQTVWLWDLSLGAYVAKNLADDQELSPGQGFFVLVNTTTADNFLITESMQSHHSENLPRSIDSKIELVISTGESKRKAAIFYTNGATRGFDNGYDSSIFEGLTNEFAIYTHSVTNESQRNLGIQSLPNKNFENMIVPVGIHATSGSNLEITALSENLPAETYIYLEDQENRTITRIDNGTYRFTASRDLSGTGRFYIHTLSSLLSSPINKLEQVRVYTTNNQILEIKGVRQGLAQVRMYSVLGKKVINTSIRGNGNNSVILPKLQSGVYLVEVQNTQGILNKKIVIE